MTEPGPQRESILIVDDTIDNLRLLASMLHQQGYEARPAPSGRLALQAAQSDPPDLILLDINMPVMNGYQVCERLKAQPSTRDIPVIFISALNDPMDKVKAFGIGASDYVSKPLEYEEVMARVKCQLALRRTRRELEQSYSQLRESEKTRDSLVHMVVHDMRSPLNVLLASAWMLKETLDPFSAAKHGLELDAILEAGERLRDMTNTVLDVSRLEAGRMPLERIACDLTQVVRGAAESLQRVYPDRPVSIEAQRVPPLACDPKLVGRVVENLVSNGLKHTPSGQSLQVCLAAEQRAVRVSVKDQGPGVLPEQRKVIFEKFGALSHGTSERFHSVGLGLALCKLAVNAHGGEIGVDSQPGEGSTFWFTLPRTDCG